MHTRFVILALLAALAVAGCNLAFRISDSGIFIELPLPPIQIPKL